MKKQTARSFKGLILSYLMIVFMVGGFLTDPITAQAHEQTTIPAYAGAKAIALENNNPCFAPEEITTVSYEVYGELDALGRCTVAQACIGLDLMPTEERGEIGQIKPTGFVQNKYPGLVKSDPAYLYNRCHLIGYQLSGENANEKNLITGTRYLNEDGMLPYENLVAEYVKTTGNHVMYRVTPVFEGNNLLATGVQMEAWSVEDAGTGVCFNVFCYNVQPGVTINYADGESTGALFTGTEPANSANQNAPRQGEFIEPAADVTYVININSGKFHRPECSSVRDMQQHNRRDFTGTREELLDRGYIPCGKCRP